MASDRCIDAAADSPIEFRDDLPVERLAHAVQALKLEVVPFTTGQHQNRRERLGVVRRELRVERGRPRQQSPSTGDVGHVGRRLAGEHRKAFESLLLGELDLGVPVGALHQTYRKPALRVLRESVEPGDDVYGALLVGLHGEPESVPPGQGIRPGGGLEDVERQVEPIGLFGVHRERDVPCAGAFGKLDEARDQLGQHPLALHHFVARMQRRELHRDARPRKRIAGRCASADSVDCVTIGVEIPVRVSRGARRLAQHVERVPVAFRFLLACTLQGLVDRAPHHELTSHDPHGMNRRLPDHGLAVRPLQKAPLRPAALGPHRTHPRDRRHVSARVPCLALRRCYERRTACRENLVALSKRIATCTARGIPGQHDRRGALETPLIRPSALVLGRVAFASAESQHRLSQHLRARLLDVDVQFAHGRRDAHRTGGRTVRAGRPRRAPGYPRRSRCAPRCCRRLPPTCRPTTCSCPRAGGDRPGTRRCE